MEITTSAYKVAKNFIGIQEVSGKTANPLILAMLQLDATWPKDDSVPWCSGFLNFIAFFLNIQRSKSLMARSWIPIGERLKWDDAEIGMDIVVLKRGKNLQPGIDTLNAPGHVGLFAGWSNSGVLVLAGNQNDSVNIQVFSKKRILCINRLRLI